LRKRNAFAQEGEELGATGTHDGFSVEEKEGEDPRRLKSALGTLLREEKGKKVEVCAGKDPLREGNKK